MLRRTWTWPHVLQDHLALFMELLGRMPLRVTRSGKYAAELFNKRG